jgi:phytoene desaturase
MGKKVVVIGSGFGGLAAAVRMLSKGFDVTVYEKLDRPGGKACVFEKEGFKFDAGPTVITAPFMFEELFSLGDRKLEDYVTFKELDPFYKIFDSNGNLFEYNKDPDFIDSQISKFNYDDVAGYRKLMESVKPIFEKGFVELADKPFLKYSDMIKVAPHLLWLKSYKSVYDYVSKYIKNDFLRRCFTFHPLLIGGNPFDTPSIYTLIHYLERRWGVFYTEGGSGVLIRALEKLIIELGGSIEYNSEVMEIITNGRKATGVRLSDRRIIEADYLIANSDTAFTFINMINHGCLKKYNAANIDKMKHSMSLFVVYLGTTKDYSDSMLEHHNIILSRRYKELINEIFSGGDLPEDFSLYVHMPTKHDKTIAPDGCSLLYALSPVPNLKAKIDWKKIAQPYSDKIVDFLDRNYLPDLKKNIKVRFNIDPVFFRNNYNCYLGSAFSFQPVLTQSAWFRPHNRNEEIDNLYLVGAGTHPGAGLPGVLSSAKIAEKLIME